MITDVRGSEKSRPVYVIRVSSTVYFIYYSFLNILTVLFFFAGSTLLTIGLYWAIGLVYAGKYCSNYTFSLELILIVFLLL